VVRSRVRRSGRRVRVWRCGARWLLDVATGAAGRRGPYPCAAWRPWSAPGCTSRATAACRSPAGTGTCEPAPGRAGGPTGAELRWRCGLWRCGRQGTTGAEPGRGSARLPRRACPVAAPAQASPPSPRGPPGALDPPGAAPAVRFAAPAVRFAAPAVRFAHRQARVEARHAQRVAPPRLPRRGGGGATPLSRPLRVSSAARSGTRVLRLLFLPPPCPPPPRTGCPARRRAPRCHRLGRAPPRCAGLAGRRGEETQEGGRSVGRTTHATAGCLASCGGGERLRAVRLPPAAPARPCTCIARSAPAPRRALTLQRHEAVVERGVVHDVVAHLLGVRVVRRRLGARGRQPLLAPDLAAVTVRDTGAGSGAGERAAEEDEGRGGEPGCWADAAAGSGPGGRAGGCSCVCLREKEKTREGQAGGCSCVCVPAAAAPGGCAASPRGWRPRPCSGRSARWSAAAAAAAWRGWRGHAHAGRHTGRRSRARCSAGRLRLPHLYELSTSVKRSGNSSAGERAVGWRHLAIQEGGAPGP
jgi:hypothetical protein